jgi:hypothetical protein
MPHSLQEGDVNGYILNDQCRRASTTSFGGIAMDESSFNMAVRKFLKEVGVTSQREIERIVREGKVEGDKLKLRMTLTAENTPLNHIVEAIIHLN